MNSEEGWAGQALTGSETLLQKAGKFDLESEDSTLAL
jgi:hypothetical protein